jgi:UDP-glucose 4-epimerase
LAVEVANKSKTDGVKQFIFLSSMSVYGMESGVITKNTIPNPKSHYGKSKLQAEEKITALGDETFKVAIVRPPMVYGKDCKGNFQTVVKIVKKSPVFPKVDNKRSMIYIETLCEYVFLYIENEASGIYLPQNEEYMNTTEMAKNIAVSFNKKIYASVLLGIVVKMFLPFVKVLKKAFGTLVYDKEPEKIVVAAKSNKESVIESV